MKDLLKVLFMVDDCTYVVHCKRGYLLCNSVRSTIAPFGYTDKLELASRLCKERAEQVCSALSASQDAELVKLNWFRRFVYGI